MNTGPVASIGAALLAVVLLADSAPGQSCDPADLYGPDQQFATGTAPWSVAIGDLNGDNILDIAVANADFATNTVSVLLGNGDGTFQPRQDFATGSSPRSVAIGDLNGDNILDLAVANFATAGTVSVLLGNGNGTFQAQQQFTTGNRTESVAIGDLNGDNIPDLAVANRVSNTVGVLLGNGNGTFQAQQQFGTHFGPAFVAIGDLDGNGSPDLVTANFSAGTISVLLGNGNGTFQAQQSIVTSVPDSTFSVSIGDLNGDSAADIVVANGASNTISVLLGNGNGTFQPRQDIAIDQATSVAIGDLDGDGTPDLAVANGTFPNGTVSVLLGNGNGTFQAQQQFAAGSNPLSLAIGDLDGNNSPDLVTANLSSSTVSVLLNQCDFPDPCPADIDDNGILNLDDVDAFVSAYLAGNLAVADLNGDGMLTPDDFDVFIESYMSGCL